MSLRGRPRPRRRATLRPRSRTSRLPSPGRSSRARRSRSGSSPRSRAPSRARPPHRGPPGRGHRAGGAPRRSRAARSRGRRPPCVAPSSLPPRLRSERRARRSAPGPRRRARARPLGSAARDPSIPPSPRRAPDRLRPPRRGRRAPRGAPPDGSLRSLDVLAAPRIDLDPLPRLHEQGHLHDEAGLEGRRLEGARDPIPLHPRLGLGHGEYDRRRKLDRQRDALVRRDGRGGALGQVARHPSGDRPRHVHLLVRLEVHEDQIVALAVKELLLAPLEVRVSDALVGAEGPLQYRAGLHVAQLRPNERAALAGLHMLELQHREQRAAEIQGHTVLQVVGRDTQRTVSSLLDLGSTRPPSGVTYTMSSIRTPPFPLRYTPHSIPTTV